MDLLFEMVKSSPILHFGVLIVSSFSVLVIKKIRHRKSYKEKEDEGMNDVKLETISKVVETNLPGEITIVIQSNTDIADLSQLYKAIGEAKKITINGKTLTTLTRLDMVEKLLTDLISKLGD